MKKNTKIVIVQLLIGLFLIEIICSFFLYQTSNPLYRARKILQYDFKVGWFQKPHLNTTFEKAPIVTDQNGFRINNSSNPDSNIKNPQIVTLGPSSAFGWGVENQATYSSLVAKQLNLKNLNASGIGHSIYQGYQEWKKVEKEIFPNSMVLIGYGINDLDKFRFFDSEPISDKYFLKNEPLGLYVDKLHLPGNFIIVLSLVIRQLIHTNSCKALINLKQRVSWQEFKEILNLMIIEMKAKNLKPIIINTPYHLTNRNPHFTSKAIEKLYLEVSQLAKSGDCQMAHKKLKEAKALEPDSIYEKVIAFNQNLRDFAMLNQLNYIDVFYELQNTKNDQNFYDPIHPSVNGHQIIAGKILELTKNHF